MIEWRSRGSWFDFIPEGTKTFFFIHLDLNKQTSLTLKERVAEFVINNRVVLSLNMLT